MVAPIQASQSGGGLSILQIQRGELIGDLMGFYLGPMGDVDGAGIQDFVVGMSGADPGGVFSAGSALVFSGSDSRPLLRLDGWNLISGFAYSLAACGDIDRDGVPDLIVGEDVYNDAFVYFGADGSLIYFFDPPFGSVGAYGQSVDGAGDVNADGHDDILAGAPSATLNGLLAVGYVLLVSGADGSILFEREGIQEREVFGAAVDLLGD